MARRKLPRSTKSKLNSSRKGSSTKPQSNSSGQKQKQSLPENDTNQSGRKYRSKPGTKALREIRHLQMSTHTLIPKAPFSRLVREIFQLMGHGDKRIQLEALACLQDAAEMYSVQLFQDAVLCCYHARRVTLKPTDIHLVRRLRGAAEVGNA